VGKGLGVEQVWLFGLVERGPKGRCYIVWREEDSEADELKREDDEKEEKTESKGEETVDERKENEGDANETEESIKKLIKSLIIIKSDSELVITSKLNKIFDFFEEYIYCFQFKQLDNSKRKLIHEIVEGNNSCLFHYTINGKLLLTNDEAHTEPYYNYCKLKGLKKNVSDKLESINRKLNNKSLTAVKQNQLLLEKISLQPTLSISQETNEIVDSMLSSSIPKIPCPISAEKGIMKLCD
jgi:hypothetical protein